MTDQSAGQGYRWLGGLSPSDLDAIIHGEPADLILMDCQMPVMSGFEATVRIRAWEREQGLARRPIVALTAGAFEGDRDHCLKAGMDDFVTKPVDFRLLPAVIAKWLAPVSNN